ncbi:hypothetical protein V2G26_008632 [Clonostachys chloroleuca]
MAAVDTWGSGGDTWNEGGGVSASYDDHANYGNGNCNGCGQEKHDGVDCPNGVNDDNRGGDFDNDKCFGCGEKGHRRAECPTAGDRDNDKCFGCGETGHRRAECPSAEEMTCRYCKQPGHMIKDCPDKPPMRCENCGEEGHMKRSCENARKINRDHVADVSTDEAMSKIKQAVAERDVDDAKEGVQEYVKALNGEITYKDFQQVLIDQDINLWFIPVERSLLETFTNMDWQGNMGKKYSVTYRFSEKPDRPCEVEGWPKDRDEILTRLEDAGDVVSNGKPLCSNCKQVGHIAKSCTEEKVENMGDKPKVSCSNCQEDGHRIRDCPIPRVDKFACKNCGQSGHKASDCEEPPNPENVECRKCQEKGHFAKDCPQGGGRACRNCGQEGHIAKECDQPVNMDNVTCRNCEKTGHFSKECPEPKDWSKVKCSNCEEYGHTKVRCKQPPADAMNGGGDGGFGGDNSYDNGYGNTNDNFDANPVPEDSFQDAGTGYDDQGQGSGGW